MEMQKKTKHRVLILSASTGQGHNACAQAMLEYIRACGHVGKVVDGLAYISEHHANFMSKGHSFVYQWTPGLFQVGWQYCERHPNLFERRSPVFKTNARGAKRLYETIQKGGFDTVISTHGLTAVMLTETLKQHPMPALKTAFISTDYTCYPCMHMTDLDYYVIPEEEVYEECEHFGISRDKVLIGGIPVRRAFYSLPDKAAAKEALGLDPTGRHLLVMGGSMGCGPMEKVVSYIAEDKPDDVEITVICGRNKRLFDRLSKRYAAKESIHITGYCDRVPLYMAASDVYMTKPGGISVSEATVVGLPMVLVNTVAGCEQYNLERYLRVGGAVTADHIEELAELTLSLLDDPSPLEGIESALRMTAPPDGAAVLWRALYPDEATPKGETAAGGDV